MCWGREWKDKFPAGCEECPGGLVMEGKSFRDEVTFEKSLEGWAG